MKQCKPVLFFIIFIFAISGVSARTKKPVSVRVNAKTGNYQIISNTTPFTFSGTIGKPLQDLQTTSGADSIGSFHSISFTWKSDNSYKGIIRWYDDKPVILFSLITPGGAAKSPEAFPHFTKIPASLMQFSYHDNVFAAPEFKLNQTSTPWLLFNKKMDAVIISPASDFIVAKLTGDGKTDISSRLNPEIRNLPAGFSHTTLMVFDKGIRTAWDLWGQSLRTIYHRIRPANDVDTILKYYGYWTDNGAYYYYNYDTSKGYAQTLLDLKKHYDQKNIPLGYMQLDSWWYEKSVVSPDGKSNADHKNPHLPSGPWNRYGGLMEYRADPYLFPDGLANFQKKLGLPMVTHNRWIDPSSPYHKMYKISGYAGVGEGYWEDVMSYIKSCGVFCYEQDWLNEIYSKSPEMASDITVGNAFSDQMAKVASRYGIDLQYCMAMPRNFLQGIKYNNLTTIRTSDDRFEKRKWMHFIFTSQFAYEMGIWPWCDVYKSPEKGNMILADLSAGPVGTGDAIGEENQSNINLACRTDGVIVKPDVPLLPMDQDYLSLADNLQQPLLGYTYTKHGNITTDYVFAFTPENSKTQAVNFKPLDLGMKGEVVIYNPLNDQLKKADAKNEFSDKIANGDYAYYIVAPVGKCGIAFLGDTDKITSTGKQRIQQLTDNDKSMKVGVLFAKGESPITLRGYSEKEVTSDNGKVTWDGTTHIFTVTVFGPSSGNEVLLDLREK